MWWVLLANETLELALQDASDYGPDADVPEPPIEVVNLDTGQRCSAGGPKESVSAQNATPSFVAPIRLAKAASWSGAGAAR
jgi:hypothetical protein